MVVTGARAFAGFAAVAAAAAFAAAAAAVAIGAATATAATGTARADTAVAICPAASAVAHATLGVMYLVLGTTGTAGTISATVIIAAYVAAPPLPADTSAAAVSFPSSQQMRNSLPLGGHHKVEEEARR